MGVQKGIKRLTYLLLPQFKREHSTGCGDASPEVGTGPNFAFIIESNVVLGLWHTEIFLMFFCVFWKFNKRVCTFLTFKKFPTFLNIVFLRISRFNYCMVFCWLNMPQFCLHPSADGYAWVSYGKCLGMEILDHRICASKTFGDDCCGWEWGFSLTCRSYLCILHTNPLSVMCTVISSLSFNYDVCQ